MNAKEWKYVSIDIETLGLDENFCDIIEFGAVLDDLKTPLQELPRYHCYLTKYNNRYQGEAYAMSMHSDILRRIANRESGYKYCPTELFSYQFRLWIDDFKLKDVVICGKNFAGFDLRFLNKIEFSKCLKFHHRILDVGSMFYDPKTDSVPPDLKECLKRSGVEKSINHTAIDDALDVIQCVRYHYR